MQRAAQQWPPMAGSIRPMGPASSHEDDRRRFESDQNRRAHEEAAAARHYLNMAAAAARTNAASLIHRSSQQQQQQQAPPSGHNNNKQQQPSPSGSYPTSAASIHYPGGHRGPMGPQKGDPGPPPLIRTNGATMSAHHNIPTSTAAAIAKQQQQQQQQQQMQMHHHLQQQQQQHGDPKYPVGFKPYEMYPSRSSSTSPNPSHLPHHASRQQQHTQSGRPSPTGHERLAHSPRYSASLPPPPSSQRPPLGGSPVPGQVYGKPVGPGQLPPPSQMSRGPIAQTPPPAHGSSAPRHPTDHFGPEALAKHHALHTAPMRTLTPEIAAAPQVIPPAHQEHVDLPLDLGLGTKRRADHYDDYASLEAGSVSPKKMLKIEPNAQLFKVAYQLVMLYDLKIQWDPNTRHPNLDLKNYIFFCSLIEWPYYYCYPYCT